MAGACCGQSLGVCCRGAVADLDRSIVDHADEAGDLWSVECDVAWRPLSASRPSGVIASGPQVGG
jgi:hypothetical protein